MRVSDRLTVNVLLSPLPSTLSGSRAPNSVPGVVFARRCNSSGRTCRMRARECRQNRARRRRSVLKNCCAPGSPSFPARASLSPTPTLLAESASSRCQVTNLRLFCWKKTMSLGTCSSTWRPNSQPAGAGETDGSSRPDTRCRIFRRAFRAGLPLRPRSRRSLTACPFFAALSERRRRRALPAFGTNFHAMISNVEPLASLKRTFSGFMSGAERRFEAERMMPGGLRRLVLEFFGKLLRFGERVARDDVLRLDPALGLGLVMGPNAKPMHLFKLHLVDHVEPVAAFDLEQIGRDDRSTKCVSAPSSRSPSRCRSAQRYCRPATPQPSCARQANTRLISKKMRDLHLLLRHNFRQLL